MNAPQTSSVTEAPRVVLAHPSGNQFFRHLAHALHRAGALAEAATCIDWKPDGAFARWLPRGLAAELGRRNFSAALGFPVTSHPAREWLRLAAGRLRLASLVRHETGVLSVDAVYRDFDRWMAARMERRRNATAVYAYEDAAEAMFGAATRLGWRRIYDLPIAYWETSHRLLAEEAERWPEWEFTLESTRNSAAKCARKTHELALADCVVCPSAFVAESLPAEARVTKRVIVAPFGSPPAGPPPAGRAAGARLRVLFAGSWSQRKGLADLFAAMRRLRCRDVELVVLGSPVAEFEFYRRVGGEFTFERARPHGEVLEFMRTCDVFCLPSIVEGRALVVQEAMSQGLPAIVTRHTGADDVVSDGVSGFVVPVRDSQALAEKIGWFADHRDAVPEMGRAAQTAAARLGWADYGAKILAGLGSNP